MRKFKEDQVIEIRRLYQQGSNYFEVGNKFGVNPTTIQAIIKGKSYEELPLYPRVLNFKTKARRKLSEDKVKYIRESRFTERELSIICGVSVTAIARVKNNKTYKILE